jgi:spermidine/putrescine transport system permease protein
MTTAASASPTTLSRNGTMMNRGADPLWRISAVLLAGQAFFWGFLFFRWITFSQFDWQPYQLELWLAGFPEALAYSVYLGGLLVDLILGVALWQERRPAQPVAMARTALIGIGALLYYFSGGEFYTAAFVVGVSGLLLLLLTRQVAWSLAYPSAFWLFIFFLLPMFIVLAVSFGERSRLGTVVYPPFELGNLGVYFNDYVRFFSPVSGDFIYLRIFVRSIWLATLNTLLCLAISFPFAYWIARRPPQYRGMLIFLVMIPFWTNFLVRTYAWMLILRDTGVINNFWTMTLHDAATALSAQWAGFAWLATMTENPLPLLFNQGAVLVGLFYGYFPFMVLPIYSNLEKMDWSLLEAASDLGANGWYRLTRVLLPLSAPGIVAGSIVVFIPSLGAYVTPDLLGGAKVALIGNLLQQQFMTVRDWPFGSAIGFILMAIMLLAVMIYFRILNRDTVVSGR